MKKIITPYAADFGKPNVVIKHFPDNESYVLIPKIENYKKENVLVCHRLYPEPDKRIFELLLVLSRLKGLAKHVELYVPYLPYARQDRENKKGEAISADVLCRILKSAGVKKMITYDCHFLPRPGNFKRKGLTIENRSAGKQLMKYAKKNFGGEKFVVISPDEGASYFTDNAHRHLRYSLKKTRGASKARGVKTEIHADIHKIEGDVDVKGKNICLLDDIISTGGTIMRATKHLREQGAKNIIVGAAHGLFAGEKIAEKILQSSCDKIFITNSILASENSSKDRRIEILKLPKS